MSEAISLLNELLSSFGVDITTAVALLTRLSGFFLFMPGIAESVVPVRMKVLLAVALTGLLLPLTEPVADVKQGGLAALLGVEAFVGIALGFTVRAMIFALSFTGAIIAQALSLGQVFGVDTMGDSASAVSNGLTLAATTLLLTAGFDVTILAVFAEQLETIPLGSASLDTGLEAEQATMLARGAIAFGVRLALPFLVLNFAFYLLMGFLNRAMPQLMVTFVGLPAITLGGLALFMLTVSSMLAAWLLRYPEVLP
ncbi:flagellar biosynthetic protein FliR [Parvularcula sp. ZS-1/3]|uniref:Flagellar biosynthetic protein FliR n=1 Tax=Parvularcula mediterranea TaxID=2732508 RepID=A0A7Y3W4D9_9PROT|nr:flagellar biosynthetic protein FliR [Parvularcula mediterranea]NNU15368.1 flagellar biosynthetic protein FliR [Parvularcula mediterranea]